MTNCLKWGVALPLVLLPSLWIARAHSTEPLARVNELTEFVYIHHVVADPVRPTYGMTYEFFRDGKQIQDFGLDSLHDGAWFTLAMLSADRAWPTPERGEKYLAAC